MATIYTSAHTGAEAVGANALVDCTLLINLFSSTADQELHISAASAWNGASVNIYILTERYI